MTGDHNNTPSTSDLEAYASQHRALARAQSDQTGHDASHNLLYRIAIGRSDSSLQGMAGAAAGFASGIVTCPLDVIKTKLQAQGGFRTRNGLANPPVNLVYKGMFGTAKVIWKEEGVRGMYRGLGPIILGYLPTWAVWFVVYGKSKEYFGTTNWKEHKHSVNFVSSIIAGASSTMVTNPIWVIKTRMMSQVSASSNKDVVRPPWHYDSTMDAVRKMYRTEGLRSFYSGLTPALLGLSHVAVQFPVYEFLKVKFTGHGMGDSGTGQRSGGKETIGTIGASFISKFLATATTYPHEVIRTRLQTQQRSTAGYPGPKVRGVANAAPEAVLPRYKGIVTTFNTILREEGWRAFYAGMGTNMMRAVPAAMTTMVTYEYVMRNFRAAGVLPRKEYTQ